MDKDQASWTLHDGPGVSVISENATIDFSSFLESPAYRMDEENPNLEAAQGHFLTFPLALITIDVQDDASITLTFQP